MKKALSTLTALCLVIAVVFSFTACGSGSGIDAAQTTERAENAVDIDITEATFKGWIKELETSPTDYIGKTVRLEGIMYSFEAKNGNTYYTVYRDGCCANDHMYSIEFMTSKAKPENGAWVELIGTFESYTEGPDTYYHLINSQITEKSERGEAALGV